MIIIYYWDSWREFLLDLDSVWLQLKTLSDSLQWCRWKTKYFGGTFSDSFWQNLSAHLHLQDILQSTSYQIRIFCHLVEVVYWPCGLTFVYPTLNLAFLGIIVKVKLLVKFCLQDFVSKSVTKYFSSLFLGIVIGSRINSWCSILFSNLKQKRTQHYY